MPIDRPALLGPLSSIRGRIFLVFFALSLVTGAIGGYCIYAVSRAGEIVVDTYDRPLMAINFTRAASLHFLQMEKTFLELRARVETDRDELRQRLEDLNDELVGDLDVAESRSLSAKSLSLISGIEGLVARWHELCCAPDRTEASYAEIDALSAKIIGQFDIATEIVAEDGFRERQKAVREIATANLLGVVATAVALLLAAGATFWLARRILRPLSEAVGVANRIAAGELSARIPQGGVDETGILLRSMALMQRNIADMMEYEKRLRRSAQARLIEALESSDAAMLLVDAEGQIVNANSQVTVFFPSMAGRVAEGVPYRSLFSADHVPVGLQAAAGGEPAADGDLESTPGEIRLPDGRWLKVNQSATRDGGFFNIWSDITGLKEREEKYKAAKREAEAASLAKSNFLANMSHELRTPLNAIIGFSEIVTGQILGPVGNPKYVEYAHNILSAGRHLLDIISGVLDIARSAAGKLRLDPEDLDVRPIVDDCASMVEQQCVAGGLELAINVPDGLRVHGEAAKLRQIFINLLSNAVKFTPTGGRIEVLAEPAQDDFIIVKVVDTGIGMRMEDIPIALAPFGQIDNALSKRYQGAGLGLSLTVALVELHRGRLEIDSAPGRGTTIAVSLPRATEAPIEWEPLRAAS